MIKREGDSRFALIRLKRLPTVLGVSAALLALVVLFLATCPIESDLISLTYVNDTNQVISVGVYRPDVLEPPRHPVGAEAWTTAPDVRGINPGERRELGATIGSDIRESRGKRFEIYAVGGGFVIYSRTFTWGELKDMKWTVTITDMRAASEAAAPRPPRGFSAP